MCLFFFASLASLISTSLKRCVRRVPRLHPSAGLLRYNLWLLYVISSFHLLIRRQFKIYSVQKLNTVSNL